MCQSMVDIQSAAAQIRRGKKEEDRKKIEDRKKLQGKNIMAPLLHRTAITNGGRLCTFKQRTKVTQAFELRD